MAEQPQGDGAAGGVRDGWPQLGEVKVTCRGGFAYATGTLPSDKRQPLFRLRYCGSAHCFGFALYSHASERYEDAVLLTGRPTGTPQEALDTACTLYLASLGHEPGSWPPANLWSCPLSYGGKVRQPAGWSGGQATRRCAAR